MNGKIKNIQDEIPFEIPESWCWVRQHNLCWLENGFETNSGNLPYLEAKVIRNQKTPTMKTSGVLLKQNSKVILVDGENSGEVMIIPFIGYMGSTFRILMMSEFVIEDYIKIYFDLYKNEYKENKTGSAIPHLNKRIFSDKLVALPPFLYQKQVSNIIKDIFNNIIKINSQIIETEKYKEKLKNIVLESIFSPNSSYKSYYENRISTNLEEYIDKSDIGDGDWVLSENMDDKGNIKLVQLKHIGSGNYIDKPYCKINNSFFEQNKCSEIKEDYLLINRLVSDKMNVCIMPNIQSKCITSVDVCWIKPNKRYLTKYLMYYLMAPCFQKEVLNLCSGSTRKRISKKNLIKIPMLIHNLNVQKEIVKEIDKIFSLIDSM